MNMTIKDIECSDVFCLTDQLTTGDEIGIYMRCNVVNDGFFGQPCYTAVNLRTGNVIVFSSNTSVVKLNTRLLVEGISPGDNWMRYDPDTGTFS